ncbi:MAG TPA: hypothetical protein VIY56_11520, partial [Vicinamibacterales bacterium]
AAPRLGRGVPRFVVETITGEDRTVAEPEAEKESTIVERWLQDQQQWQRTLLAYVDSMTKNEDFLVHLGNAMRGSLLAGKAYPAPPAPGAPAPEAPADDRLDHVLHAVHQLQGQMQDVLMALEELRGTRTQQVLPLEAPPSATLGQPSIPAAAAPRTRKRQVGP